MTLKTKELAAMTKEALMAKAIELKQELAKEKATVASGTRSENPGKIRKLRRDIARILTAMTAKDKAPAKAAAKEAKKEAKPKVAEKKAPAKASKK